MLYECDVLWEDDCEYWTGKHVKEVVVTHFNASYQHFYEGTKENDKITHDSNTVPSKTKRECCVQMSDIVY
jgi:hypothetical protein